MITRMKKLTFLVYHKEYESFLERIRELGVVHVVERQRGEMDTTLQSFLQKRTFYKNVAGDMFLLADKKPVEAIHANVDAEALAAAYEQRQTYIQELNARLPIFDKDIAQMEIWGDFDWQRVRELDKAGWHLQFYSCQERDFQSEWEEQYNLIHIQEKGLAGSHERGFCQPRIHTV